MQGIIIATSGRETNCASHTLENVLFPLTHRFAFLKENCLTPEGIITRT